MERIRFTIAVEPDVHSAFAELAEASGQSLSRAVGDWLRDTSASSRFVAQKMRELRMSPATAMRELQAFDRVHSEEIERLASGLESGKIRVAGAVEARHAARTAPGARNPPPSNTGGKGRKTTTRGPRK